MIELRDIRKVYQLGDEEVHALDGVSLTIRDHEFVAIIGASGSGKSTLMKCLFGIYKIDEGEVRVDGEKMTFANPDDALHQCAAGGRAKASGRGHPHRGLHQED